MIEKKILTFYGYIENSITFNNGTNIKQRNRDKI